MPDPFARSQRACASILLAFSFGLAQTATSRIRSVRIEGLKVVDTSYVRNCLKFSVGDSLTDDGLSDRSRESLRQLMSTQLFADANIEYLPEGSGVTAHVTVVENPVSGPIKFVGNSEFNEKDLKDATHLSEGGVLSNSAIERDRSAMRALYVDKGYRLVKITPQRETPDPTTGRIPLTWKFEEGSKVRVQHIYVEGDSSLRVKKHETIVYHSFRWRGDRIKDSVVIDTSYSHDEIMDVMETKEKRWWRSALYYEDTLINDLGKIRDMYREKGFLDAKVDTHWVNYSTSGVRMDVHLTVSEGRRYRRGHVAFAGNELFEDRQLRTQLLIDSGDIMNGTKFDAEEQQLASIYREEGRLFVQINPIKTYRNDSIIDVLYTIKEGQPATVAEVIIEGNTKTRDKVIRRELKIFPGDLYHQSSMMRSQREVMQLNFFDNVLPDIRQADKEGEVNIVFKVTEKEKGTGTFSAGGAYSQSEGLTGTLGVQVPNIMGTGRRADVSLQYGEYAKKTSLSVTEPWLFDTPTSLGGSVFYSHTVDYNDTGYDYTSYGFGLNVGRRLKWPDDYFSVGSGYTLSHNEYGTSYTTYRTGYLLTDGWESSLSFSVSRDDKDLPVFPTSGSVYSLSWRKIGGPLGGDFDCSQTSFSSKWWFPAAWKFVLGVEATGGVIQGDKMQASDLYRMGGTLGYSGKLRGYNAGSIGSSRLGRSYISTTAELRFPVVDGTFYLVGFADAGNVFGRTSRTTVYNHKDDPNYSVGNPWTDIDMADLKRDAGLGFRLQIPMMGILGFDFGYGFDPQEDSNGQPYRMSNPWVANFVIETGY